MVIEDQFVEKMTVAYPRAEENLIDFLNRCKISNINAMLCPRCSAVFDKETAKSVEGFRPRSKRKRRWADNRQKFGFNPPAKSPTDTWVFSGGKKSGYSAPPTKWVKRISTTPN